MNRKRNDCVICHVVFEKPKRVKYCSDCKIKMKRESRLKHYYKISKKEFDLFCIICGASMPINSGMQKMYCKDCKATQREKERKEWYIRKTMKSKLDKFYKVHRISLIQSPYLSTRPARIVIYQK